MAYIEMQHCYKRYTSGETEILLNQDVSFEIEKGELVIIFRGVRGWKINSSQYLRRDGHE